MDKRSILTLPNLITFVRLGLLPWLLWALVVRAYDTAFWLFVAASLGDGLDGYLARRLNQSSWLGALLDPVADKLTILGIAWILADQGWLPVWIVIMMSLRDLTIVAGAVAYRHAVGHIEMAPSRLSKINTALEFLLLAGVLMSACGWLEPAPWLAPMLTLVAATVLASGVHYVWLWSGKARDHAHRN